MQCSDVGGHARARTRHIQDSGALYAYAQRPDHRQGQQTLRWTRQPHAGKQVWSKLLLLLHIVYYILYFITHQYLHISCLFNCFCGINQLPFLTPILFIQLILIFLNLKYRTLCIERIRDAALDVIIFADASLDGRVFALTQVWVRIQYYSHRQPLVHVQLISCWKTRNTFIISYVIID